MSAVFVRGGRFQDIFKSTATYSGTMRVEPWLMYLSYKETGP